MGAGRANLSLRNSPPPLRIARHHPPTPAQLLLEGLDGREGAGYGGVMRSCVNRQQTFRYVEIVKFTNKVFRVGGCGERQERTQTDLQIQVSTVVRQNCFLQNMSSRSFLGTRTHPTEIDYCHIATKPTLLC